MVDIETSGSLIVLNVVIPPDYIISKLIAILCVGANWDYSLELLSNWLLNTSSCFYRIFLHRIISDYTFLPSSLLTLACSTWSSPHLPPNLISHPLLPQSLGFNCPSSWNVPNRYQAILHLLFPLSEMLYLKYFHMASLLHSNLGPFGIFSVTFINLL